MSVRHGDERATIAPEVVAERLGEHLARVRGRRLEREKDGLLQFAVERESLVEFVRALRDDENLQFKIPLDVTALDHAGVEPRFEVIYHLYSVLLKMRIRIRTTCRERDASVPSLMDVMRGVDFHERETFDMFGIRFEGHPDLRRILLPDEFLGHPLRKDYPVEGIEPERVYRLNGGVMMARPPGAEPIDGARSDTP
jgi:NADH-quinone oxidoreductase subunit C